MATITNMIRSGNLSLPDNQPANQNQNSINVAWQDYLNSTENADSTAADITEVRQNATAVMESYDNAKQAFYNEFDETMSALRNSAANVRNLNFNVGANAITRTENVASDGTRTTTTTYSDAMKNVLGAVRNLVDDYNSAINFFRDNSAAGARIGRMAQNFGDTVYRANSFNAIGISVGRDGTLAIDEDALANAINKNPNRVANVLGRDGFASKVEQQVNTALNQRDKLFPDAKSMLGNQLDAVALYTGRAFVDMTIISNIGNLVNRMF